MYKLKLTASERQAIDWIGYRYFHGDDFYQILMDCYPITADFGGSDLWNEDLTIEFEIPEHLAWEIKDGFENEDYEFACFSEELAAKLLRFCNEIV